MRSYGMIVLVLVLVFGVTSLIAQSISTLVNTPLPWQCNELGGYEVVTDDAARQPVLEDLLLNPGQRVAVDGRIADPSDGCYVNVVSYSLTDGWRVVSVSGPLTDGSGAFRVLTGPFEARSYDAQYVVQIVAGDVQCVVDMAILGSGTTTDWKLPGGCTAFRDRTVMVGAVPEG